MALQDTPVLKREHSASSVVSSEKHDAEKAIEVIDCKSVSDTGSEVTTEVIVKAEDVAVQVRPPCLMAVVINKVTYDSVC